MEGLEMELFGTWLPHSIVFWSAIVLIVLISGYFRYLTRASKHRLLEKLAEKGQSVTPELLDRIDHPKRHKD